MARARAIDTRLEKLVPSMEEYFIAGIFTKDELRTVAKERTMHEYKLVAKPLLALDVQQAIHYELDLEKRVREFCGATSVNLKHRWAVQDRITHLFQIGLRHLRDAGEREGLRKEFVSTMKRFDRRAALSNHYATFVTKYPNRADLWVEAALYEAEVSNTEAARTIVQHALKHFADRSVPLWVCSLRIELQYLSNIMTAMLKDLADRQVKAPEGATVASVFETAAATTSEALLSIVFDEMLARVVVDGAVQSPAFGSKLLTDMLSEAASYPFARRVAEHLVSTGVPKLISMSLQERGQSVHRRISLVGSDESFAQAIMAAIVDLPHLLGRTLSVRQALEQTPPPLVDQRLEATARLQRLLGLQLVPAFRSAVVQRSPAIQTRLRDATVQALKDVAARNAKTSGRNSKKGDASAPGQAVSRALQTLALEELQCSTQAACIRVIDSITGIVAPGTASCANIVGAILGLLASDCDEPKPVNGRPEPLRLWGGSAVHSRALASGVSDDDALALAAGGAVSALQQISAADEAGRQVSLGLVKSASAEIEALQKSGERLPLETCAACRWSILLGCPDREATKEDSSDDDDSVAPRKRRRTAAATLVSAPMRLGALCLQQHLHAALQQDEAAVRAAGCLVLLHAAVSALLSSTLKGLAFTRAALSTEHLAEALRLALVPADECFALLQRADALKEMLAASPPLPRQVYTDVLLPLGEAVVLAMPTEATPAQRKPTEALLGKWFEQLLALYRNGGSSAVAMSSTYAKAVLTTDLWRLSLTIPPTPTSVAAVGRLSVGHLQAADWCRYVAAERRAGGLARAKRLSERALKDAVDARTLLVSLGAAAL
jgi:hypothetical protein